MSLALWLRAGRAQKGLSLEDVAKITKIQPRILERLETGKLDGLPAEVFVRGFIRSVAKCVGLDESEALTRYSAAQGAPTTIPTATASAVAFVESMSDLAPSTSSLLAPVVLVNNPPIFPAGSIERLPASLDDEIDDVEIDVDIEPAMLANAPVEAPATIVAKVDVAKVDVAKVDVAKVDVAKVDVANVEASPASVDAAHVAATNVAPANIAVANVAPAAIEVVDATPVTATPVVEAASVETSGKKKRTRKPRGTAAPKGKRKAMATGTPSSAVPVVASESSASIESAGIESAAAESAAVTNNAVDSGAVDSAAVESAAVESSAVEIAAVTSNADSAAVETVTSSAVEAFSVESSIATPESTAADELFGASTATMIDATDLVDATSSSNADATDLVDATSASNVDATASNVDATADAATASSEPEVATSGTWKPSMPTVTASSVPWRRPSLGIYATSTAPVVPTLVIDDADPETAASQQDDRANVPRRSFLPPILAERAKNAASGQGTLTLAVIILLIAATLTLSYLMRRPSSSGDGVTRADGTVELIG